MATPQSRQELVDYCLRNLGEPVIEVNLDDDQIDDRVDEALQYYQEYHMDAVVRKYFKHQLTSTDVSNEYITLPESLLYVTRVLPIRGMGSSSGIFSIDYQMHLNDLSRSRTGPGDLVSYELTKQFMSMIDLKVNGSTERVNFSRHMDRLTIEIDWTNHLVEGEYVIVEGYETIDPETYTDVYNDAFVKEYLTALLKRQWGRNLSKFEGMQLPGGITLNGRQILDEANEEIQRIKEQMDNNYGRPLGLFVG